VAGHLSTVLVLVPMMRSFVTSTLPNSSGPGVRSILTLFEDRHGTALDWHRRWRSDLLRAGAFHQLSSDQPPKASVGLIAGGGTRPECCGRERRRAVSDGVPGRLNAYESKIGARGFGGVRSVCWDQEGVLWIASEKGLFALRKRDSPALSDHPGETFLWNGGEKGAWLYNKSTGVELWRARQRLERPAGPVQDSPRCVCRCPEWRLLDGQWHLAGAVAGGRMDSIFDPGIPGSQHRHGPLHGSRR